MVLVVMVMRVENEIDPLMGTRVRMCGMRVGYVIDVGSKSK